METIDTATPTRQILEVIRRAELEIMETTGIEVILFANLPGLTDIETEHPLSIEDVVEVVCEYSRIADVERHTRRSEYVKARQIICYLTKKLIPKKSLKFIGERLGGQDHTTIIHSIQTVSNLIDTEDDFKETVGQLRVQIETRRA